MFWTIKLEHVLDHKIGTANFIKTNKTFKNVHDLASRCFRLFFRLEQSEMFRNKTWTVFWKFSSFDKVCLHQKKEQLWLLLGNITHTIFLDKDLVIGMTQIIRTSL